MISKSTKAKRRRNAEYHRLERTIRTSQIDGRGGNRFYLLSLPVGNGRCIHLRATGEPQRLSQTRWLQGYCMAVARGQAETYLGPRH